MRGPSPTQENISNLVLAQQEVTYAGCMFTNCPLCGTGEYSKQPVIDDPVPR